MTKLTLHAGRKKVAFKLTSKGGVTNKKYMRKLENINVHLSRKELKKIKSNL